MVRGMGRYSGSQRRTVELSPTPFWPVTDPPTSSSGSAASDQERRSLPPPSPWVKSSEIFCVFAAGMPMPVL